MKTKNYTAIYALLCVIFGLLFCITLTLKLMGCQISWWIVTAPLWFPIGLSTFILAIVFAVTIIKDKHLFRKKYIVRRIYHEQ